jgi:deoxyadenosine/deoxycytidine kinase
VISNWGNNFVNNHLDCTFNEFAQAFCKTYRKVQIDEQVYMTLKIIKQNLNKRVEDYYKQILNLANFLQHPTNNCLLNAFLRQYNYFTFRWLLLAWKRGF